MIKFIDFAIPYGGIVPSPDTAEDAERLIQCVWQAEYCEIAAAKEKEVNITEG